MSAQPAAKLDLHELLFRNAYDHAVITTFSFDPTFFEDYCLEKLRALSHNGNVTVVLDGRTYESILAGEAGHRPEKANLRYLLHPVFLPGAFHAKVFLFASRSKGLLVVGSANFTHHGLTHNAELVGAYRFEAEKNVAFRPLFVKAFDLLQEVAMRWGGDGVQSNLRAVARDAAWLVRREEEKLPELPIKLLHNIREPLWPQLRVAQQARLRSLRVLSKYFNADPGLLDVLHGDLKPSRLAIYTQNGGCNLRPAWWKHPSVKDGRTRIFACGYNDEGHVQTLHAKALAFERADGMADFAFGSANFTRQALQSTADEGNFEMLLWVPGVPSRKGCLDRLFDPVGNGVEMKDASQLQQAPEEETLPARPSYDLLLEEASLCEQMLAVRAKCPDALTGARLTAELLFHDDSKKQVALRKQDPRNWQSELADDLVARLSKRSTVVRLLAKETNARSNPVLLVNLQDVRTGQSVRRERHVREAQESSAQFSRVLNDLIRGGDDEALRIFLTYCDIPFRGSGRPGMFHTERAAWEDVGGLRDLGQRNLRSFLLLDEAAVEFLRRHLKRLGRHVKDPDMETVPNFMHITVAVAGVIRAQVERALAGMEGATTPLSTDEWYELRDRLGIYALIFKDLLALIADEYIPALARYYKPTKIRAAIEPELDAIESACAAVSALGPRVGAACQGCLRVATSGGPVKPEFGPHDTVSPVNWPGFDDKLRAWKEYIVRYSA